MIEFSEGYKNQAKKKLEELKASMTEKAWLVSLEISEMLKESSTKFEGKIDGK